MGQDFTIYHVNPPFDTSANSNWAVQIHFNLLLLFYLFVLSEEGPQVEVFHWCIQYIPGPGQAPVAQYSNVGQSQQTDNASLFDQDPSV